MKINKELLLLLKCISILFGISFSLSLGLLLAFSLSITQAIGLFLLTTILQIFITIIWRKYAEKKKIEAALDRYDKLQYKKYLIPLICQSCGYTSDVEIDLTNTEYTCHKCNKKNAIYINFSTASITEPLIDPNDVLANVSS